VENLGTNPDVETMSEIRVAALYVLAASSPYANIPGVDLWPERRDARKYSGPWPVVAHPPCAHWSKMRNMAGDSPSQARELAPLAVAQVRRWGGILEHPAGSLLWDEPLGLPRPEPYRQMTIQGPERDDWGGFTIEVDQSAWGHPLSHKRTWLYMVGVDCAAATSLPPDAEKPKPARISTRVDRRDGKTTWARSPMDLAGPDGRKRSPPAFARCLVELAAGAAPP
jgi:hypothetical protein